MVIYLQLFYFRLIVADFPMFPFIHDVYHSVCQVSPKMIKVFIMIVSVNLNNVPILTVCE